MTVLPWPGRRWELVPCAEPGTTAVRFPAVYRGIHLQCTAKAGDNQVTLEPLAGVELEIPLDVWMSLAPYMTVAALTARDDEQSSPPAERG